MTGLVVGAFLFGLGISIVIGIIIGPPPTPRSEMALPPISCSGAVVPDVATFEERIISVAVADIRSNGRLRRAIEATRR
jgi:hypothetical protein